jgi:hypothetical protein
VSALAVAEIKTYLREFKRMAAEGFEFSGNAAKRKKWLPQQDPQPE